MNNLLEIIDPDKPTLYPYACNSLPSFVDIVINKNLNKNIEVETIDQLDLDHLPILVKIKNSQISCNNTTFLNYKKANWEQFRNYMNDNLTINNVLDTTNKIDDSVNQITQTINNAINFAIPKVKPKLIAARISLPPEIKALIIERNKIRKTYQQTNLDYLLKSKIICLIKSKLK